MAFFPHNFFQPSETSFTPLFRLLDDYESHSRQSNRACNVRRQTGFQWQPKFDIREVGEAYELHGELPGITKDNVHIEFSDPQTLVVRGRNERSYTAGTSPHAHLVEGAPASPASPALSSTSASHKHDEATTDTETQERRNSHQATVEDEDEAMERESAYEVVAQEEEKKKEEAEAYKIEEKKPVDKAKYWLTERSVGSFYRSFHFPTRVEQDSVTASFQDGILSISVPKAKKHESRRIYIA